ncbi:hypothetical protein N7493_011860 [Penicillium malachiteum]|uniref:Uncharacterized protein n=1 Tax=Penicillium malachiteum TaxID=1324776 RepID=A0AAD6HAK4_9EURO|nr:hypothetical protein N7493_011860 [Penicillium malachiteum]
MFLRFFKDGENVKYDKLTNEVESEKEDKLENSLPEPLLRAQNSGLIYILILSNLISALLIIATFTRQGNEKHDSFESGFRTDFGSAREHIELEHIIFSGAPAFTYTGIEFQRPVAKVQYVGKPSPEIDQVWEDLVTGNEFLATEEEVKIQWPDISELWDEDRGGYVISLDVFQTLSCLDLLRRGLTPSYYNLTYDDSPASTMNRCIETIRQSIMCATDLTPSPSRYNPGLGHSYIDTANHHTCRDFDRVHRWVKERSVGKLAVKPVNKQ